MGVMRLTPDGPQTLLGGEWRDGLYGPPKIDPEAAFRAAWRAWNDACEQLDHMPGHGEDIDMMKRAARERGLD